MKKTDLELVFCIVNQGFADSVMDSARSAGATGGTIISGHGSANQIVEQKFGLNVQHEKEIVMIIVPSDIKDDVMTAINNSDGLTKDGKGVTFSLPVTDAVGFTKEETEKKKD